MCCRSPVIVQLVEKENVRAVISYNEAFELRFFTNSKKVDFQSPYQDSGVGRCFKMGGLHLIWGRLKMLSLKGPSLTNVQGQVPINMGGLT